VLARVNDLLLETLYQANSQPSVSERLLYMYLCITFTSHHIKYVLYFFTIIKHKFNALQRRTRFHVLKSDPSWIRFDQHLLVSLETDKREN